MVDQFEELFTLCAPEAQARFAALLGRLAGEAGVHVLLSMRDDFLMRCHEHEALAPVFAELTPLGPLAGEALRRALEEPAKAEGFRFEEGLVGKMTAAVEGERGALPLLAFAVSRLWEKRDRERKLLTQEAYAEIGGVAGALARHAEATLERIGAERQGMVREVFRNLVTAQGTRAACDREELLSVFPDRKAAEEVLGQLVAARLLTSWEMPLADGAGEGAASSRTRPSPDRDRPRVAAPVVAAPRALAGAGRGGLAAARPAQAGRAPVGREGPPARTSCGRARPSASTRCGASAIPGSSRPSRRPSREAMTDRALRRRRLRRAALLRPSSVVSAVAIVVSVSRQQAVASPEARAEASRLVALGRLELETDPTLTLAYARKSLEVHDSSEARRLALEALWRGPVARVLPVPNESDGVHLRGAEPRRPVARLQQLGWHHHALLGRREDDPRPPEQPQRGPSPAGALLRRLSPARDVRPRRPGDGRLVRGGPGGRAVPAGRIPPPVLGRRAAAPAGAGPGPAGVAVRRLAGSEVPRRAYWGVSSPGSGWPDLARAGIVYARDRGVFRRPFGSPVSTRADVKVGEHDFPVAGVNVHDGTGWIVSFDERREVRIWDGTTHRRLRTLQGLDPDRLFPAPLLDARGTFLAWHSLRERAFPLWDLAGPPDAGPVLLRKSEVTGDTGWGAFLPDGRWLATALSIEGRPLAPADAVASGHPGRTEPQGGVHAGLEAARLVRQHRDPRLPADAGRARGPSARGGPRVHVLRPRDGAVGPPRAPRRHGARALLLAPLDGGEPQPLVRVPPTESICRRGSRRGRPLGGDGGRVRARCEGPAAARRRPADGRRAGLPVAGG